ncbi:MAG: hypothetical protein AAFR59_12115, partial [Bacteroidota bacterium]
MHLHLRLFFWTLFALMLGGFLPSPLMGQPFQAYEASWKAGGWGVNQNPASLVSSPYKGEFMLGSLNLSAGNNLFATNRVAYFSPLALARGFQGPITELPYLTGVEGQGLQTTDAPFWNAQYENQIQAIGVSFHFSNPDKVERGWQKSMFGIRFERNEYVAVQGVPSSLAQAYARGFEEMNGVKESGIDFEVKVREFDALVLNYGVSLGKGKNRLHLALGGKFLSASSFLDFKAYNAHFSFSGANQLTFGADSFVYAYNPSLGAVWGE